MTMQYVLCLLASIPIATAKFESFYSGSAIAAVGMESCIANSNFTTETVTRKENCREVFKCIMANTPNHWQTILSSASAILGFIPTVLLLLGNTNEDIIRIHARFPVLALFLSLTNVNKSVRRTSLVVTAPASHTSTLCLGPYGVAGALHPAGALSSKKQIAMIIAHLLAAAGMTTVIWHTVELGKRALLSWACPTDFYLLFWIGTGILHHLLSIICLRLSLGCNCAVFFQPDLTLQSVRVVVKHTTFLRWSKVLLDALNNVNYLYGTVVFSSLTLVSAVSAMKILVYYGLVTTLASIIGAWVLEEMGSRD